MIGIIIASLLHSSVLIALFTHTTVLHTPLDYLKGALEKI